MGLLGNLDDLVNTFPGEVIHNGIGAIRDLREQVEAILLQARDAYDNYIKTRATISGIPTLPDYDIVHFLKSPLIRCLKWEPYSLAGAGYHKTCERGKQIAVFYSPLLRIAGNAAALLINRLDIYQAPIDNPRSARFIQGIDRADIQQLSDNEGWLKGLFARTIYDKECQYYPLAKAREARRAKISQAVLRVKETVQNTDPESFFWARCSLVNGEVLDVPLYFPSWSEGIEFGSDIDSPILVGKLVEDF